MTTIPFSYIARNLYARKLTTILTAANFDIRKHLLEYDDVMNKHREVIYGQRRRVLSGEGLPQEIQEIISELGESLAEPIADEKTYPEEWDYRRLNESLMRVFSFGLSFRGGDAAGLTRESLIEKIRSSAKEIYARKETEFGSEAMRYLEKPIYLQTIDTLWKEHLLATDHLKEGIGLRGYGQRNPLQEYQKEGYQMFMDLIHRVKEGTVEKLFRVQMARPAEVDRFEAKREKPIVLSRGSEEAAEKPAQPVKREARKVGRNEPCPCGNGKKYKKCCAARWTASPRTRSTTTAGSGSTSASSGWP